MRSTEGEGLTTQTRIRDAAIVCLASEGLQAPLRTIAAHAGVSAALIVHHFGSREGLVEACRSHALAVIEEEKGKAISDDAGATMLVQLANAEGYAPITAFVMRCLQQGGSAARAFTDDMARATEAFLEAGVAAGTVRPSRDPHSRARLMSAMSIGVLLSWFADSDGPLDLQTFGRRMAEEMDQVVLPALELYTDGLFLTRAPLEAYLAAHPETPDDPFEPSTE